MKIFTEENSFDDKVNFIDDNNVFIGYDLSQQCCENANWYLSTEIENNTEKSNTIIEGLEDYNFDVDFFEELGDNEDDEDGYSASLIRFRLIKQNCKDLFLHIYNVHNGYYSHGFTMSKGDKIIHEGSL